jgi:probable F420-dependent oxidoreductase
MPSTPTETTPSQRAYANRPVRVGAAFRPQHCDYADLRRAAATAEEAGVDIVFNWDHFFPLEGDPDGKHFECWTMLASWAEATERVELGPLVACNSYRNPDLLADMARTVDHISAGRLILGLGSGWNERDYVEYGYPFGKAGGRLDDLSEALPRIEQRLGRLNPPPVRKIPILIGGGGEQKTLRIAAQHADIWHGYGDAETIARKHSVLDDWCAKLGRDPGEIERSAGIREGEPSDVGTALLDLGTRLFTIPVSGPAFDLAKVREWTAWRDEVNARQESGRGPTSS